MTAGNVDVALRTESSYRTADTNATFYQPGKNVTVGELDLDNQLQALRDPNNPVPIERLAGNLEGALGLSFTLAGDPIPPWHDLVFDGGALPASGGRAPSAECAIGLDYIGGKIERLVQGVIVTDVALQWQQGQVWTVELTMLYGDETKNTDFTPTAIETLDAAQTYTHAATDVTVDATSVQGLSSLTLSLSELARLRRGTGRRPYEAVIGGVTPTLDLQADFTDESPSHLELAYGDATEPVDAVGSTPITIEATTKSGDTLTYNIGAAKPATYGWADLVEADADEQESITFEIYDAGNNGVNVA